MSKKVFGTD